MQVPLHMQTNEQHRRKRFIYGVVAICIVLLCILAFGAYKAYERNSIEQGALTVREAILDSAIQCAAIEGSYPSELSYLEQNYGLSIDYDNYIVIYDCFASNSVPGVSVVPR